ncbi:MAG: hypothetical protein HQL03_15710 [Nitrospirae bacterium]|nr:hypothetical protein [Nitrospirota bacterium]
MSYVRRLMDSRLSYVFAVFGVLLAFLMLSVQPGYAATTGVKLTVSEAGDGTGMVGSNPDGINCGATGATASACSASYPQGTIVMLTAKPDAGSTLGSWAGCDPSMGVGAPIDVTQCKVTMSDNKTVTATFKKVTTVTLTVNKAGDGTGMASSTPPGINCGTTGTTAADDATVSACSAPYPQGTVVTLTAMPAVGSTFGGWAGCDQGSTTQAQTFQLTLRSVR